MEKEKVVTAWTFPSCTKNNNDKKDPNCNAQCSLFLVPLSKQQRNKKIQMLTDHTFQQAVAASHVHICTASVA